MTTSHRQRGAIGGLTRAATAKTRAEITQAARDKQFQQFLDQVPEDIVVPQGSTYEKERQRRAELLRKAHMKRLALKASAARIRAARARRTGESAVSSLAELDNGSADSAA